MNTNQEQNIIFCKDCEYWNGTGATAVGGCAIALKRGWHKHDYCDNAKKRKDLPEPTHVSAMMQEEAG